MCDDHDLHIEVGATAELSPGLRVRRRSFLRLAAAAIGSSGVAGLAPARAADLRNAALTFEEFLAEVVPLARTLVQDTSRLGQDRYLTTLASLAVRLSDVPLPKMGEGQGVAPGTSKIGVNPGGDPFTVLHWILSPGAKIAPHAHTYGNVVTVGLEGGVLVENYEMVGVADFEAVGDFRVRRTRAQWLTPHTINQVNLEQGYVHGFLAGPEGARGLDITTRIRPKPSAPVPGLVVTAPVDDPTGTLFVAHWRT